MLIQTSTPPGSTQHPFGTAPVFLLGWVVVLSVLVVGSRADEGVGLSGINSQFAPPELDTQFLSQEFADAGYPESWQKWADELDEQLLAYFDLTGLDVNAQRELIGNLNDRVATMKRAISDPRYGPIHERLYALAVPLEDHLKLSTAILDTLDEGITPISEEQRQRSIGYLEDSTRELRTFLSGQENGEQWIELFELSELENKLGPKASSAELSEQLDLTRRRLENTEAYTGRQLKLMRNNPFWAFRRAVAQVDSILKWEKNPPTTQTLRETLRSLSHASTDLDRLTLIEHGQTLQLAWDQLALLNENTSERFAFLHERFYSDNAHTYIAEDVFDEVVRDTQTETRPINEVSGTATVTGTSTTTTVTSLDLIPSPEEALLAVKIQGDIESQAVAETCCIKVYTYGKSQFWAEKPANFDGYRFKPFGARISVNATNIPYAAETPFSCLPGFGTCFDQLVLNQAIAQRPQTEADIRQRIADRVVPELNRELDNSLADANRDLGDRYDRLARNNLYPASMKTATTDTHFLSKTLIRDMVDLGGGPAPAIFNHPTGVNYHIHESLFNNIADRMDIAGRTMTEDEFREEAARFLTDLTGTEYDFSKEGEQKPADQQDKFVFDKLSPIRFQIRDSEVQVNFRMGLIRSNGEEIPPHDVTLPLKFQLEGDKILIQIDPKTIPIARADGMTNAAQARGMRLAIEPAISEGERSRFFTFNFESGKSLTLSTDSIKAVGGWLSIWMNPVEGPPMSEMPVTPAMPEPVGS